MIRLGDKELVFSTSFMLAGDELASFEIPIDGEQLRLDLKFIPGASSEREGRWNFSDGVIHFEFVGWRNSIGTAVSEPQKFGEIGDRRLYFQMAHYLVGEVNVVHFQLLLGDSHD
jgi:hypothetical protein